MLEDLKKFMLEQLKNGVDDYAIEQILHRVDDMLDDAYNRGCTEQSYNDSFNSMTRDCE